ncbi:MAG: patatin-like phospholipase family protein [Chitinophagaceae bacterium]
MQPKNLTNAQKQAYENLKIPLDNRIILCLDGGGMRGILTLQLLKKIEEIAGIPCWQFCDQVAGTSTGAIIAGLIAFGKTASEIEELYIQFVTKVFLKRNLLSDRFLNPPKYDKKNYRAALKEVLGDITLEEACKKTTSDIFITAKDVTDNEETYFTCFENNGQIIGTYKDALLRTVMEATMSAPTYFHSLERFIDGGTTTYNNPSLAALLEAVRYSGKNKYAVENITLFSLGTGIIVHSVAPPDVFNPPGLDAYFWLNYVMDASSQDASAMQVDTFRSGLFCPDYRRFQISLDTRAIELLPDKDISNLHETGANWLRDVTDEELKKISMDDVTKFGLMKKIGEAMCDYIMRENKFTKDLNNTRTKRDELITAYNNVARIYTEVTNAAWLDESAS